jgi:uncharacterized membrane protein YkvA (DUF1232 family)
LEPCEAARGELNLMHAVLQSAFRNWLVSAIRRVTPATAARSSAAAAEESSRLKNRTLSTVFAALALLYTLWPVDFIPDIIPVLGWLDDGMILLLAAREAWRVFRGRSTAS